MTRSHGLPQFVMLFALLVHAGSAFAQGGAPGTAEEGGEPAAQQEPRDPSRSEGDEPEARGQRPEPDPAPEYSADDATVELRSDLPLDTEVGQPVALRFSASLPEGAEMIAATLQGNEYVEGLSAAEEANDGTFEMELAVFRPGMFEDVQLEVRWLSPSGEQLATTSAPFSVDVRSIIANEDDPQLAEPEGFLVIQTPNVVLMALLFGAGGGALLALLIALIRRRDRPVVVEPPPPPRPAWEIAFEELDALQEGDLLAEGHHLEFHMQLSEIVRRWLKNAYHFNALEMTTSEIRRELDRRRLVTGPLADDVLEILADSDIVKFARFSPDRDDSLELMRRARGCVEEGKRLQEEDQTVPPPPEEGDQPERIADPVRTAPQPAAPGREHSLRDSQAPPPENVVRMAPRDTQGGDER